MSPQWNRPGRNRPRGNRPRGKRLATAAVTLGLVVLVGASLCAATARVFWAGELVLSLRLYLGAFGLLLGLLALLARRPRTALVAALLGAWHVAPVVRLYTDSGARVPSAPPDSVELVVAGANLWNHNEDLAALEVWLARDDPDVLAVFEVSPFWEEALGALDERYPHRAVVPPQVKPLGRFGLGVLSKHPLSDVRVVETPFQVHPHVEAVVHAGGAEVLVVAVHLMRAGRAWRHDLRNEHLRWLAHGTRWRASSVVVGDLNATMFTPSFSALLEEAGCVDTRRGFGYLPSWSPPFVPGYWLDLDHALVRGEVGVLDRRVGAAIGSDHRPTVTRIAVPRREAYDGAR